MTATHGAKAPPVDFSAIETVVRQGKAVVSSEDSAIVRSALKTVADSRTATLYLKPAVMEAILKRYWTPNLAKAFGLQPITDDQAARIKADFNIEIDGAANTLECPRCGHGYSTYEFIQQGMKEHGEDVVRSVFAIKGVAILQINPQQTPICQNCSLDISRFVGDGYGACYHYEYKDRNGRPEYACCQLLDEPILTARAAKWALY